MILRPRLRQLFLLMLTLLAGLLMGLSLRNGLLSWMLNSSSTLSSVPIPPPGPPRIEQVRDLATLLTTRLDLVDVQRVELVGYSGAAQAALVVRGQVELGIDLSAASLMDVDHAGHIAVLHLPSPAVVSVSVDHDHSSLVGIEYRGLWWLRPEPQTDERLWRLAMSRATQQLSRTASAPDQLLRARQHAQEVVRAWSAALGWRVDVRWDPQ